MDATSRQKCVNSPDSFCYICGCYTLLRQRRNITSFVMRAYKAYFEVPLGDQDKKWTPHIVCHKNYTYSSTIQVRIYAYSSTIQVRIYACNSCVCELAQEIPVEYSNSSLPSCSCPIVPDSTLL